MPEPGFDTRPEPLADSPAQRPEDLGAGYLAYREQVTARSELDALLERVRQRRRPMAEPDVLGGGPAGDRPLSETGPGTAQEDAGSAIGAAAADIGRGLVEAPTQAVAGALDGMEATGDLLETMFPISDVDTGERQLPEIDDPKSVTGGIVRGAAQFLVGFIPALRAARGLKVVQGAGLGGELAAGATAGAVADFTVFDPHEARLSDLLLELGLPENEITGFLKADPEDGEIEGRFKNLIEGAGLGALTDGVFMAAKTIQRGLAARRGAKGKEGAEADPLATQRERFGEVGDRDFLILGDPAEPLFKVAAKEPESGAAKMRASEAAVAEGAPSAEVLSSARRWIEAVDQDLPPDFEAALDATGRTPESVAKAEAEARVFAALDPLADNEAELAELLGVIRRPPEFKGERLINFLIGRGGLKEERGAFAALGINARTRPGLIRKQGKSFDDAARDAWENGFFPDLGERPTLDQFIEALEEDFTGRRPRMRLEDESQASIAAVGEEFSEQAQRDLLELGIDLDQLSDSQAIAKVRQAIGRVRQARGVAAAPAPEPQRMQGPAELGGREVFVNFSRIDAPEDVQAVIGQMADAFSGDVAKAQRGKQSFEQTRKLADELGLSVPDLLARRQGQPFNAEEALAARRLWAASAEKLLETARAAADPNAGAVDQFNFRRMLAVHHAVQAEVIGARTETARALNAWKIPAGGGVERAREVQLLLESFGGPRASAEIAKRLALLEASGAGPEALAAIARRGWAATTADAIKEVWVNGLLSSPKTHVVNTSSNLGVAFQQILERGAAGRIAALRGAPDGVASGEAAAMAYGLTMGLKDAFRMGWQALLADRTGASLGKIDLPRRRAVSSEAFGLEQTGAAGRTVDFLGNAFRVPGRLLGAEDEFFKTIGYRMELHAQALRQATSEGLRDEALYLRMGELVANPPEHIRIAAADAALYNTFTNQPGWFGQAVMAMRGAEKAGSPVPFVLPFVRTPVNIARYAFERTPLAPLVGQWRADVAAGGARRDLALARMGLGSAVMLVAADYADLGLVSGRGPQDTGEREAMRRQGWQPYSIKVGERWVSYNRADPFGMTMGFAADIAEAVKRGELDEDDVDEWQEVTAMAIAAVSSVAVNKTYLSGMAEFTQMMADPTRYSERYVNDFVGSFVPFTSVMRAGRLAADPELKEVGTPFDAVSDRIIGLADALPPRRDLWGQPIRLESGLSRTYDFFAPWTARAVEKSPIDAELLRLGADIRRIPKKTSFQGVNVNLKNWPDVYDDYTRLAGNGLKHIAWNLGARDLLDRIVEGRHALSQIYAMKSDGKDGGKAAMIRNLIGEYRQQAQRAILADPRHAAFADHIGAEAEEKRRLRLPMGQGGPRIGDAP